MSTTDDKKYRDSLPTDDIINKTCKRIRHDEEEKCFEPEGPPQGSLVSFSMADRVISQVSDIEYSNNSATLLELSLMNKIFRHLPISDLYCLRRVCSSWNSALRQELVGRDMILIQPLPDVRMIVQALQPNVIRIKPALILIYSRRLSLSLRKCHAQLSNVYRCPVLCYQSSGTLVTQSSGPAGPPMSSVTTAVVFPECSSRQVHSICVDAVTFRTCTSHSEVYRLMGVPSTTDLKGVILYGAASEEGSDEHIDSFILHAKQLFGSSLPIFGGFCDSLQPASPGSICGIVLCGKFNIRPFFQPPEVTRDLLHEALSKLREVTQDRGHQRRRLCLLYSCFSLGFHIFYGDYPRTHSKQTSPLEGINCVVAMTNGEIASFSPDQQHIHGFSISGVFIDY